MIFLAILKCPVRANHVTKAQLIWSESITLSLSGSILSLTCVSNAQEYIHINVSNVLKCT